MHRILTATTIAIVAASASDAFITRPNARRTPLPRIRAANDFTTGGYIVHHAPCTQFYSTRDNYAQDIEMEQMMRKAANLRAGAASLEADKARQLAEATKDTTMSDKIISTLPYLFPLIDGLQYGQFLFGAEDVGTNPVIVALAQSYSLVHSVPLLGVLPFFALNILSRNQSLNRLLRFNSLQAIFLEIGLIFPSMILRLDRLIVGGSGTPASHLTAEIFSEITFMMLLLALFYSVGSTLAGNEPNGIPLVSRAVGERISKMNVVDGGARFVSQEYPTDEDVEHDNHGHK